MHTAALYNTNPRSGVTLVVTMCLMLLGCLAVGSVMSSVLTRTKIAFSQVCLEQAFYVASAGAEYAATYVANGNDSATTLSADFGNGRYTVDVDVSIGADGERNFDITSVGTVNNVSRRVVLRGIRRVSWARYAMWYDSEATKLWIVPGERFDGRFYSRPQLHFHNNDLATKGQARFTDKAWTAAATIEKASSAVNPIFEQGLTTSAAIDSMASVNFPSLLTKANSGGLVLNGATTIVLNGTTMKVTNSRAGWSNKTVAVPANGLVYVKTATTGTSSTKTGDLKISAPSGFNGRASFVADHDILVTDHVLYANDPQTDPGSTDAIGLIAKRNVAVQTSAPNNLEIFAHIIAQTGGFGVDSYNSGSSRGVLTVYGGIVNSIRNAVGIVGGSGYTKNYIFDRRFATNPPPNYPTVTDELEWSEWEG